MRFFSNVSYEKLSVINHATKTILSFNFLRCLVKNPEHRPVVMELADHPFIQEIPEDTGMVSLSSNSLKIVNQLLNLSTLKKKTVAKSTEDFDCQSLGVC